jgi:nucleoside-diphosphate-sugar epimerase
MNPSRRKEKRVAIFGASGHIAKGFIKNFLAEGHPFLDLYSRVPGRVRGFLKSLGKMQSPGIRIRSRYAEVNQHSYDVIINCTGPGTLNRPGSDPTLWFTLTEAFDNLAIGYLREVNPETLYISLSSGAVYGRQGSAPADQNSVNRLRVNHLTPEDHYMIARLNAETKHRAFSGLRIVDLRIFNYFSRYIDLEDRYFITDVLNSIRARKPLLTGPANMVRDYAHPDDLFALARLAMGLKKINTAFDVTSVKPANKKEILDYFAREYGLNYRIQDSPGIRSATGAKSLYYSQYKKAAEIGFQPRYSSMDTLRTEAKYILTNP